MDNDFYMLKGLDNFIKKEKEELLRTNLYYQLMLQLLKTKIYYYWTVEDFQGDILGFCDEALEILNQPSQLVTEADPFFDNLNFLIVGVTQERSLLYSNIDHRVDQMIANGFLEEVQSLLNKGFPPTLRAFNSPGYRELISYTTQDITWDDAVSKIKTKTHTLARKQYNWFKPNDHSIHWFDSCSQ